MISFAIYYTHEPAGYLHVFLKNFYPDESLSIYARFRVVFLCNSAYSKAKKFLRQTKQLTILKFSLDIIIIYSYNEIIRAVSEIAGQISVSLKLPGIVLRYNFRGGIYENFF